MKQSNFSVKLFTQTLLSLLLTFVFTSAASAQDYSYRVARDGFVSVIAAGYPDSGQHIGNHTSDVGDKTIFGWYKAGTELTFKLDVHNTGDTFYSDTSLNPDGISHAKAFQFSLPLGPFYELVPITFMGFEDLLGGGDMDFNDNMAMFSNVVMVPVPEPSMMAMLFVGLALLTFSRKSFLG